MSKSVLFELTSQIVVENKSNIRFKARGSSMRPYIRDGDIVEVSPVNDSEINKGDVLLFKDDADRLYLHRVLENRGGKFVVKGDSSRAIDGIISPEKIIGRLVSIKKKNKTIKVDATLSSLYSLSWTWYGAISFIAGLIKPGAKYLQLALLDISVVRRTYRNLMRLKLTVTLACPEDSFAICNFYHQYDHGALSEMKRQIDTGEAFVFVARFRDRLIGCSTVAFDSRPGIWSGWWLSGVQVNGKFHGLGIGQSIVLQAIQKVKEADGSCLKLLAFENSRQAVTLYSKLGFETVNEPEIEKYLKEEASANGTHRRIFMVKKII